MFYLTGRGRHVLCRCICSDCVTGPCLSLLYVPQSQGTTQRSRLEDAESLIHTITTSGSTNNTHHIQRRERGQCNSSINAPILYFQYNGMCGGVSYLSLLLQQDLVFVQHLILNRSARVKQAGLVCTHLLKRAVKPEAWLYYMFCSVASLSIISLIYKRPVKTFGFILHFLKLFYFFPNMSNSVDK